MENSGFNTVRDLHGRMDKALDVKPARLRALLVECTTNPLPRCTNHPFEARAVAHIFGMQVQELFIQPSRNGASPQHSRISAEYG